MRSDMERDARADAAGGFLPGRAPFFVASGVPKRWVILWQVVVVVLWTSAVAMTATGVLAYPGCEEPGPDLLEPWFGDLDTSGDAQGAEGSSAKLFGQPASERETREHRVG